MIGGTFFRLGTGAMPFLFPLMLQLAFGLNAFQTGTITFASAVGAFGAKFLAEGVLQRIGFRTAMLENGKWVPTFPKARYLIGRAEYEFMNTARRCSIGLRSSA